MNDNNAERFLFVIVISCLVGIVVLSNTSMFAKKPKDAPKHNEHTVDDLLNAMAVVETGDTVSCRTWGDNGASYGPLQISVPYYQDADMRYGTYDDCQHIEYAKQVAMKYWKRYAPNELKNKVFEVLARIHNGGPKGHLKPATNAYWQKVKIELERKE